MFKHICMNVLIFVIHLVGKIWSFIFPINVSVCCGKIVTHLYTGYYSRCFSKWGKRSIIKWSAQKLVGLEYVSVGDDVVIDGNVQITAWSVKGKYLPEISIGDGSVLRQGCHITAVGNISIGCNLLTGTNVIITDNSHGASNFEEMSMAPVSRDLFSKGPVRIGDNVWLGNNVCVMPGVTIGDGVIVGANSVVTSDIPSYSVAVGAPAKVVSKKQQVFLKN